MSKLLPSVMLAGFAALVGVGTVVGIGAFDVSASTPHWGVTTKFLQVVRDRSIAVRSADVVLPGNLEDRSQLVEGVVHFQAHCAVCHGAPGVEPSEIAHGMYPSPPDLGHAAMERSPAEIFWIVKNGIKMSGMPAWGGHGDERLWPVVALTSKLPTMTAAAYAESLSPKLIASAMLIIHIPMPPKHQDQDQDQMLKGAGMVTGDMLTRTEGETAMRRKLAALTVIAALGVGGVASFAVFQPSPAAAREAIVYKSPTCGCCKGWATYLQRNGYKVTTIDHEDMDRVKDEMGVPETLRSCHTAKIGGAVVEGHVPLEAIEKFLAERPQAKGLASPGMPSGSPGMDGPKVPNTIYTFGTSGVKQYGAY